MIALDFGLGGIEQDFWHVVFMMTRIGAALVAAPIFGSASVPFTVRVCVAGALAIFAGLWLPGVQAPANLLSADGMLAVLGEVLVGVTLGFVLQLAFAVPAIAAELISGAMGMSMAMTVDPAHGTQTTAFGQYFTIVLTVLFLATGAHLHWIALVMESYSAFPPGQTWISPERIELITDFAGFMFATALRIALPVALILLLMQIFTGVLSRSAPALNLFAVGLPAGVLTGIAALIISMPLLYDQFTSLSQTAVEQVGQVLSPAAQG